MNVTSENADATQPELLASYRKSQELAEQQLRCMNDQDLYPGGDSNRADNLAQQLLYETWLKKGNWQLEREAIPLLFGIDPEHWPSVARNEELQIALAPLQENLTGTYAAEAGEALVAPADVYRWASGNGLKLPAAFEQLVQFILATVKPDQNSTIRCADRSPALATRESVLGAALGILARYPERCRDGEGRISASRIVALIENHAVIHFDSATLPMAKDEAIALIRQFLH